MKYLLDTCIVSYFLKGNDSVLEKIKASSPNEICISTITYMEIMFGLSLNVERGRKLRHLVNTFIGSINVLPFTLEDGSIAGSIRAKLQKQGTPIGSYDVLLAGCALSRDLILVTANIKEFKRINGLVIENWYEEVERKAAIKVS